jgi:glycosyltransferase involved in cell wall biosynthesis
MVNKDKKEGWLFILPWSPWSLKGIGGVSTVVRELCKAVHNDGNYYPYVMILDWSASKPVINIREYCTEIRYRIRSPLSERGFHFKTFISFIITLPVTLFTIHNLMKRFKITVVNPHFPDLTIIVFSIIKQLKPKRFLFFISFHGRDIINIEPTNGLRKNIWRKIIKSSDRLITCSKGLARQVSHVFPENADSITYIHNGVSPDFINALNNRTDDKHLLKKIKNKKYILSVGTFEYKKGHDILIHAFSQISKDHKDLYLVLVGRSGPELKRLQVLANQLQVNNRTLFINDISSEKMFTIYKYAELFVSASRYEPFGIAMLEAGVADIPVIATQTTGATEIIVDSVNGLLIPLENANLMAQAISELINDEKLKAEYSKQMKLKILNSFTWGKALNKYIKLAKVLSFPK